MAEPWLERWEEGRIGWHERDGNLGLKTFWPRLGRGGRVLVPFCGKTRDLIWLAGQGLDVVGIELSKIGVTAFFSEHRLEFQAASEGKLVRYHCLTQPISIYCGDYFDFSCQPFDALYDRAALVATPQDERPRYIDHTRSLLKYDAYRMIITMEYDQTVADGPPFSVMPEELLSYWNDLQLLNRRNILDSAPPKFRDAGLREVFETVWSSPL